MKAVLIALVFALLTFSAFAQQTVSGCDVCQFFVKEIETEVTKYEGQITDAFKKQVCGKLPAALNSPVCYPSSFWFVSDFTNVLPLSAPNSLMHMVLKLSSTC